MQDVINHDPLKVEVTKMDRTNLKRVSAMLSSLKRKRSIIVFGIDIINHAIYKVESLKQYCLVFSQETGLRYKKNDEATKKKGTPSLAMPLQTKVFNSGFTSANASE